MGKGKIDIELAALNQAAGMFTVNKFGRNQDIDTATDPEDVWEGGGLYTFPTTAREIQVASGSANDTSAGTGAKTIVVQGLDANWEPQSVSVTMTGASVAETTETFIRVFRAYVATAGTVGTNDGLITLTYKTDATTAAVITAGSGQTLMALYTVPAGYTALLYKVYAGLNSSLNNAAGSRCTFSLRTRSGADISTAALQTKYTESLVIDGTSRVEKEYIVPSKITEKTDIIIRVDNVTDNDSDVTAGFDLVVIDNDIIDGWY